MNSFFVGPACAHEVSNTTDASAAPLTRARWEEVRRLDRMEEM
jgi:hypothetical protein